MGKLFLTSALLTSVLARAGAAIELPPPPQPIYDLEKTDENADQDLNDKRQVYREEKVQKAEDAQTIEKKIFIQKLVKEATKPRNLNFGLQISLLYPHATVSSPRSDYLAEITSHFLMFYRTEKKLSEDLDIRWLLGFRMASFAGSGIEDGIPGRFGFTYVGPILGIGRIGPPSEEEGAKDPAVTSEELAGRVFFPVRQGWHVLTGISWLSRVGSHDPSVDDVVGKDFVTSTKPVRDGSGLWIEASYFRIYYGAIGVNLIAGIQMGEGKRFEWVGIGMTGWY